MTHEEVREYAGGLYLRTYESKKAELEAEAIRRSRTHTLSDSKSEEIVRDAQKFAIRVATMQSIEDLPDVEASLIWRGIYETHVHRKSGVDDADVIREVVSADQSWRKSSGHAFEEMIKILGADAFKDSNIEIVLQKDLSELIRHNQIKNEPRDIEWLKAQIKKSIFDLYAIVTKDDKKYCYGCIQSKTSIRDRVTRDREPSLAAMQSYFWSIVVVLDGDFLRMPKFNSMVNGGDEEFEENGWHGMYVFSEQFTNDRIYSTDLSLKNLKEHAEKAADYWLRQRQWFNTTWRVEQV